MESLGFSLQGETWWVGLDAAVAATHALWSFQWHHDVSQFCRAKRAAMDQFIMLDYTTSDSCTNNHKAKLITVTQVKYK